MELTASRIKYTLQALATQIPSVQFNLRIGLVIIATLFLSSCSDEAPKNTEPKATAIIRKSDELRPVVDRSKKGTPNPEIASITPKQQVAEMMPKNHTHVDLVNLLQIKDKDIVLGSRDAAIKVIEYSSPTCPHCSYFHKEILPQLRKKYIDTGKITYIFREFVVNKQDLDASILGRCYKNAADPLKLFDVIYISQENWAFNKNYREILGNMGQLAGITREKYAECLNDADTIAFLINNARSISTMPGFGGTPAFFVNGQLHKGAYSFEGLSKSIDDAMNQDPK